MKIVTPQPTPYWPTSMDISDPEMLIADYVRREDYVGLAVYMQNLFSIAHTSVKTEIDYLTNDLLVRTKFHGLGLPEASHRPLSRVLALNVNRGMLDSPERLVVEVLSKVLHTMTKEFTILASNNGEGNVK